MEGNLISGNTSAGDGSFVIDKVPAGKYVLQVQFIGYKTYNREVDINSRNSDINIGKIYLEPDVAMLDGVTIVAERTTIEQRIDRKVINVGKDLTTTGAVSYIHQKLPTNPDVYVTLEPIPINKKTIIKFNCQIKAPTVTY